MLRHIASDETMAGLEPSLLGSFAGFAEPCDRPGKCSFRQVRGDRLLRNTATACFEARVVRQY